MRECALLRAAAMRSDGATVIMPGLCHNVGVGIEFLPLRRSKTRGTRHAAARACGVRLRRGRVAQLAEQLTLNQ
jgi:hypothetical protein